LSVETGLKNEEQKRKLKDNNQSKLCSSQEKENQVVKEEAEKEIRKESIEGTSIIAKKSDNEQEGKGKSKENK
jgi:hypothetical protein